MFHTSNSKGAAGLEIQICRESVMANQNKYCTLHVQHAAVHGSKLN